MSTNLPAVYTDFEHYDNSTKTTLYAIADFFYHAATVVNTYEFILAVIGTILNVFHLLVLTRKSMRSNSTNVLMIGIAMCDLFIMMFCAYQNMEVILNPVEDCWAPSSYPKMVVDLWASAFHDNFRRLSAWLGIFISFFRLLIVKKALNPKFEALSRPSFAWKTILIALVFSSIVSIFYFARLKIFETTPWIPAANCSGFPANYSEVQYNFKFNDLFMQDDILALKIFLFTDGALKIIPALALPILTFLLIRELRMTDEARRKISTVQRVGENSKTDQTTSLVILMTVTFIFAEAPIGIINVVQGALTLRPGLMDITTNLAYILGLFVALNATTHCAICLTMSSQYRTTAKQLFFCGKEKKKKSMITSVSPKISVTSATSVRHVVVSVGGVEHN